MDYQDPGYVDVEDSSSVEDVTPGYSARGRGGRRRLRLSAPVNQYSFYMDQDTLSDIEAIESIYTSREACGTRIHCAAVAEENEFRCTFVRQKTGSNRKLRLESCMEVSLY